MPFTATALFFSETISHAAIVKIQSVTIENVYRYHNFQMISDSFCESKGISG